MDGNVNHKTTLKEYSRSCNPKTEDKITELANVHKYILSISYSCSKLKVLSYNSDYKGCDKLFSHFFVEE